MLFGKAALDSELPHVRMRCVLDYAMPFTLLGNSFPPTAPFTSRMTCSRHSGHLLRKAFLTALTKQKFRHSQSLDLCMCIHSLNQYQLYVYIRNVFYLLSVEWELIEGSKHIWDSVTFPVLWQWLARGRCSRNSYRCSLTNKWVDVHISHEISV